MAPLDHTVSMISAETADADGTFRFTGGFFTNAVDGEITGAGTLDVGGTDFTNNGTVAPGDSPGAGSTGSRKRKRLPFPASLSAQIRPPWASTRVRPVSRPSSWSW